LPRMVWNCNFPNLSFLSSWNDRYKPQAPS
jgi:hypothetical protein